MTDEELAAIRDAVTGHVDNVSRLLAEVDRYRRIREKVAEMQANARAVALDARCSQWRQDDAGAQAVILRYVLTLFDEDTPTEEVRHGE